MDGWTDEDGGRPVRTADLVPFCERAKTRRFKKSGGGSRGNLCGLFCARRPHGRPAGRLNGWLAGLPRPFFF